MVRKLGKLMITLSVFLLLTACSIFSETDQKRTSTQEKTNSKSITPKTGQQQDIRNLKLNPNSVILINDPENKKFPKEIVTLVQTLLANDEQLQRSALTPELEAALPKGRFIPKDTVIHLNTKDWRQEDSYANIVGKINIPGKLQQYVLITFVYKQNGWKITLANLTDEKSLKDNGFRVP
jgi:hypothetical protein